MVCNSELCPRCLTETETIDHCLFFCGDSVNIWNICGLHSIPSSLQGMDRLSWCKQLGKKYGNIVFVTLWVIWCARNDFIFNNNRESMYTSGAKIHTWVKASADAFMLPVETSPTVSNNRRVKWSRPAEDFVCLNVDGSLLGSNNTAGYGGLLRNRDGDFIWGFYGVAAVPNILLAETMAIWHGFKLCWDRGYRKVLCCSDSLLSVKFINEGVSTHHRLANEILRIQKLLASDWEVILSHTLREGNACADVLAKMGASSSSSLVVVTTPPNELARPLLDDAWGVEFVRG